MDVNGKSVGTLAETVYNLGANTPIEFDFASLILIESGHKLKLTYTNAAGVAMNVYTIVERLR